jgi:glycosyltransferase involved in cell wall biosynthesis
MDALGDEGIHARLLLMPPDARDPRVVSSGRFLGRHMLAAKLIERLPVLLYRNRWQNLRHLRFSPALLSRDSSPVIARCDPDIIHLHWINYGHISPEGLGDISQPIVWTAHDMWPFTGGCHYSGSCKGFEANCGCCPVLGSIRKDDCSAQLLARKARAWRDRQITLACPSKWLANHASNSTLFHNRRVCVVPNPLDLGRFSPGSKRVARARLELDAKAPVLLFGAHKGLRNPEKGFPLFDRALQMIVATKNYPKPHLAVVGADESQRGEVRTDLPVHFLGRLDQETMVEAYRAADLFVLPSLNDNLPNMVAEALACGTPCVAFDAGGVTDMIAHEYNGFLADAFEPADLAEKIIHGLDEALAGPYLSQAARTTAETMFAPAKVAQRYIEIYRMAQASAAVLHTRAYPGTAR